MPDRLVYHQATFDLLGVTPVVSLSQIAAVRAREEACGHHFPAPVVEWCSLEGAEDLFHKTTDGEWLTPIEDLGNDPDQLDLGFLCVAEENQGVVVWYVRLDTGNDPPVLGDAHAANDLRSVKWVMNAPRFSDFVYQLVAEYQAGG